MKGFLNAILIGLVLMIPSASTSAGWCASKSNLATTIYGERTTTTEADQISALVGAWNKSRKAGEDVVQWYKIVDVKRMIRDIYRSDKKGEYRLNYEDPTKLHDREMYQCMTSGY